MKKWLVWLLCVIGVELTGIVSSFFAGDIQAVYQELSKPPLSPPGGIIGIVWTILYVLMGTSLFLLIVAKERKGKQTAIVLFIIQQVLNFSWSIIFFGGEQFWIASVVIVLLILTISACLSVFHRINRLASYLFVPYLIWCLYAGYLCIGLAVLN